MFKLELALCSLQERLHAAASGPSLAQALYLQQCTAHGAHTILSACMHACLQIVEATEGRCSCDQTHSALIWWAGNDHGIISGVSKLAVVLVDAPGPTQALSRWRAADKQVHKQYCSSKGCLQAQLLVCCVCMQSQTQQCLTCTY